jgi:hypothetical protein
VTLFGFPACGVRLICHLGVVLAFLSCCGARLIELEDQLQSTIDS